jgi:hypothetical protein
MSVIVLCPRCLVASTFHRLPISACPHCDAEFAEAVRAPAERALAVAVVPKPFLLQLGTVGSLAIGAMMLLFLALAPFDIGSYSISGEAVSGPEFLRATGLLLAMQAANLLAVGIGLWQERSWTRPLMIAYWLTVLVADVAWIVGGTLTAIDGVGFAVEIAVSMGVAAWYLYRKTNVAAYYDALKRSPTPSNVATPSGNLS